MRVHPIDELLNSLNKIRVKENNFENIRQVLSPIEVDKKKKKVYI